MSTHHFDALANASMFENRPTTEAAFRLCRLTVQNLYQSCLTVSRTVSGSILA
jgi:hypothetical protein